MRAVPSYIFIVNPAAGSGASERIVKSIQSFCARRKIRFEIRFTCAPGDARRIASDALAEGFSHFISVGGDGTSSEIAVAIARSDVKFGAVPAGSGNDFVRACGIPLSTQEALENLVSGKSLKADMGLLDGAGFINGFGIGMDGAIAAEFSRFRFLGGFAGYLASAALQAFSFEPFSARISSRLKQAEGLCLLAGVSNGPTQGGFRISPLARPDDGLLDFHFVKEMTFPMRILRLISISRGRARGRKWIERFRSDRATIQTEKPLPAHLDGEPFTLKAGAHEVAVIKGALNVISSV